MTDSALQEMLKEIDTMTNDEYWKLFEESKKLSDFPLSDILMGGLSNINVLKERFKRELFNEVKYSHFETGFQSIADIYLEGFIKDNGSVCIEWISELYKDKHDDKTFVVGLLHTLSHLSKDKITEECIDIIKDVLSIENYDCEIVDSAVMAIENWEYIDGIPILEKLHINENFLYNYIKQVIHDLKELKYGFK
jgi:hypothetical protein